MNKYLKSTGLVCAGLLALSATTTAVAQIEEIVVTATKRAESVQDVPISVSAYSGDFLEKSDIRTIQDLSLYAPNFTMAYSSQATNARIVVRGIGSVGNSAIETSVGVFIDGVYYPRPGSVIGNLLDIQTAEVLRGPQGTLFGRNTAAGALNITTRDPGDEFGGYVQASVGDFSAYGVEGVVNAPFSDSVAARFAVKYTERDGYGFNTLTDEEIGDRDDLTLRAKFGFDFSDNLYGKLTFDYNEVNSGGQILEVLEGTENPVFGGTLAALFGENNYTADGYDMVINQDHQDSLNDEQWGVAAQFEYTLAGGGTLKSITAYRDWEANNRESALRITGDVLPRDHLYDTTTFSQEFQYLSPTDDAFTYVLGLFYYEEDFDIDEDFDAGVDACIPVVLVLADAPTAAFCNSLPQSPATDSDYTQDLTSIAAFAQATYNFSDRFSMTFGGRYTSDEKDAAFVQTAPNVVIGSLFRAPESVPDLTSDDSAFTWLVNASFHPSDDVMWFGTVSTGFKGGGFNSGGSGVPLGREARIFSEEEALNYEVGVKSMILDGKATANITYFHTELDDFQDRSFDGISFLTRNAGKRTQSGIEADFVFNPVDSLMIFAGLGFLDAEFDSFEAASPLPGDTVPQDLSGQTPHFSPDFQGSLVAEWTADVGNNGWFLRPEYTYIGEQNLGANTNLNPQSVQGGYGLVNLSTGLLAGDESWQVTLYGKNLADERYCEIMFDQPLGLQFGAVNPVTNTVTQRCIINSTRTYGVSFRLNFGS
jgi:iron complex outermembrane receptor protein